VSSISEAAKQKLQDALDGPETAEAAAASGEATEADTTGTEGGAPAGESGAGEGQATDAAAASADEPTAEETAAAEAAGEEAAAALGEDATDEEKEAARSAAETEFYAGNYKTREEAEKGIAEQNLTIDRLFSERDELSRQLKETEDAKKEPQQLDTRAWETWAAEAVQAGAGAQGAMDALKEGGYEGYEVYLRHWLVAETEDGEADGKARAEAIIFNNQFAFEMAEVRAAAAAQRERATPSVKEQREEAYRTVKAKRPDIDEYAAGMHQVVADMSAEDVKFMTEMASSGPAGQAKALEMVYLEAKLKGGGSKEAAKQAEAARRRASADAATLAATTSSSEGTTYRTPPPAAEAYGIQRKRELRERQNLEPLED